MRFDLTDAEWRVIEPLPPPHGLRRARVGDRRVFYVLRTGAPWRDLPASYAPYTTAYDRFNRWSRRGVRGLRGAHPGDARQPACGRRHDHQGSPRGIRRVLITAGQPRDGQSSHPLLADLPPGSMLLADKAYDSRAVQASARARKALADIPSQADRKHPHPFDRTPHRARDVVERAFRNRKEWRRVATRHDKLARNHFAAVQLSALKASYPVGCTP